MKRTFTLIIMAGALGACSTLDQSMRLGGTVGAMTGVLATHSSYGMNGKSPSVEETALNGAVGLGIGLITSYFIHQNVVESRDNNHGKPEIYFGDLPPSPFVFPKTGIKKGGQ